MENKKLGHLMLDLETMGNKSNAAIVSIGAVEFDLETGETGNEFYRRVDLQSCIDKGLIVNGSTIYWWLKQNEKARNEICRGGKDLATVLMEFSGFMNNLDKNIHVWGNGARFDIGLTEDAYVACGYQVLPWNFYNERDVRTLVSFAPEIKKNWTFSGITHDPISDCKHQIAYCCATWKKLNK